MNNHKVLWDFVEFWVEKNRFEVQSTGNCEFRGQVSYSWKQGKQSAVDIATVRLIRNGFEDGKVSVVETPDLPVDRFHLDFSPDYQDYGFRTEDGAITIDGNSPKMKGAYRVTIIPLP